VVAVLYTGIDVCRGTLDDMGGVVVIILVYFVGVARGEKYGWRGAKGRFRLYMRLFDAAFMSCDVIGVMLILYTYRHTILWDTCLIGLLSCCLVVLLSCCLVVLCGYTVSHHLLSSLICASSSAVNSCVILKVSLSSSRFLLLTMDTTVAHASSNSGLMSR
jgi:hypothetical protein